MTYKRLKTCLILEVAFASLVADGAVQRVVTEEEFHHSLSRLKRRDRRDIFLQNSTSKFSIFGCFEFEPEASSLNSLNIRFVLAFRVKSELVCTFQPFITGIAQAATGFADFSTSTRHILH